MFDGSDTNAGDKLQGVNSQNNPSDADLAAASHQQTTVSHLGENCEDIAAETKFNEAVQCVHGQ
jgi:hypothetical protein